MTILTTARLVLRPPRTTDQDELVCLLNNFNVSRWTGRIPHPYGPEDAEAFLRHSQQKPDDALIFFITAENVLIGGIGIEHGELGYWIGERHWGRGFGTEAARAVTEHAFDVLGRGEMTASYHTGNDASRRILLGLGFEETETGVDYSRARKAEVELVHLLLNHAGWEKAKERRR